MNMCVNCELMSNINLVYCYIDVVCETMSIINIFYY
jgi:hypothetical protein